ncbi:MAG: trigger factor [Phycisphaerae bacterium]|nr:trigger factor [Phycisphaerae bacterium]
MADEELEDQQSDDVEEQDEQPEEQEKSLQEKLKEVVDVQVEDLGGLRKKLTITVPRDTIGEQLDEQYGQMRNEAVVPGFRKGRAPRRLLEKRFGRDVNATLIQQMLGTGYMAAVDKADLKVIGDPLIWVKRKDNEGKEGEELADVQTAMEEIELPDDGPLTFACEVEIRPEFDLPEIENIPLEKPVVTVTDEDVQNQLERFRATRGTYEVIHEDGAVETNDMLYVDLKMTCDGTVLKEQQMVRMAARGQVIEGVTLETLGELLAAAKTGETRTASGQIPDDYVKAECRGKQADFEFTIREIQRLKLPELNEEFFKGLGFEDEQEFRDFIRKDLESRIGEQVRQVMAGQVYKYLEDKTSFELPPRLSERQADRVLIRHMVELYRQGASQAEVEKRKDEIKTSSRELATREMKRFFIMEKLSEAFEDIEVSEGEINNLIATIAYRQGRRFDRVRDELAKEGGLTNLYLQIRDEKLIERLIGKAQVTEKTPEPK